MAGVILRNIMGVNSIASFASEGAYFGEAKPDFAFARIDLRGLPVLDVSVEPNEIEVGLEVATLGFPLGEDPLAPYDQEKASQFTPFARRGIVSSVIPCACPEPHGFTVDVLSEGGASGSPIFRTDAPIAIGILHQSFEKVPITYGIPGHFLVKALRQVQDDWRPNLSRVPTLEDVVAHQRPPGTKGFEWTMVKIPE